MDTWFFLVPLVPLLVSVGAVDMASGRIPDAVNAAIAVLGLGEAYGEGGVDVLSGRLLDAAIVGLLLLCLRRLYHWRRGRSGLGLGDVKFLVVATLWTGLTTMPLVVFLASVAALVVLALRRLGGAPIAGNTQLRFGPYLAAALFAVLLADRLAA